MLMVNYVGAPIIQNSQEVQSSTQHSQDSQSDQQNNHTAEAPANDCGSVSASSNDGRKVSRQDIELVRAPILTYFLSFPGYHPLEFCYL